MQPFAWPEFPWTGQKTSTENANLAVQKAYNDGRGPVFFPSLVRVFNGTIPANEWKEGGTPISDTYSGFMLGFNANQLEFKSGKWRSVGAEGLLLTWSVSCFMHQSRKLALGTVNQSVGGSDYMPMEIPFRKKGIFYWKIENTNPTQRKIDFSIPFMEIRR
jgi:hypothetical protein